jgi:hypothetical protein
VRAESERNIANENLRLGLRIHREMGRAPSSQYLAPSTYSFKSTFHKRNSEAQYNTALENERIYVRLKEARAQPALQLKQARSHYRKHLKLRDKIRRYSKVNSHIRRHQLTALGFEVGAGSWFR